MKSWLAYPIFLLACAGASAETDFYRWVDADGKVQYSDKLPPADVKKFEKPRRPAESRVMRPCLTRCSRR